MWKNTPDTSSDTTDPTAPVPSSASSQSSLSSGSNSGQVRIRIIRPNGTSRDVIVAGHFREEHLCSLVDDELCQLDDDEALILHLFDPDLSLTQSLRNRWREGMSDNRHVFVREVLGPSDDPGQVKSQLKQVRQRMASGERVNLAIRSPRIAEAARNQLRKLLLISQRFDESLLNVWVHGSDAQQRRILGKLEDVGMVRIEDYEQFIERHPETKWRAPWLATDSRWHGQKQKQHRRRKQKSSKEAVSDWIKRVEEDREHHPR